MASEKRTRLRKLESLRDSGVLETTVDGETVKFASMNQLNRAINRLQVDLGIAKQRRGTYTVFMGHR